MRLALPVLVASAIAVVVPLTTGMAQAPKAVIGLDFLNERLPVPETQLYDEGE